MNELEAMNKRLQVHGVEGVRETDHGWCHSLYAVDPNGIMVEFCVTTDAEAFLQTEEEALRLTGLAGPYDARHIAFGARMRGSRRILGNLKRSSALGQHDHRGLLQLRHLRTRVPG